MSKKIIELIKNKAVKGDVGIEIEVEGKNLSIVDNYMWRSENDGSLRGRYPEQACEYILRTPIKADAVKTAVDGLLKELTGATFDFSYRTSVHVHINVQQLLFSELLSVMYTYYLLEEPLMNFCGKKRKGNNFCLRLSDAEGVLDWVLLMFNRGFPGMKFLPADNARYAAMNIEAVKKYGSLEFRGMEGNIDPQYIHTWCQMLVDIRNYGKDKKPKDVYDSYQKLGADKFLKSVVGSNSNELMYARIWKDMETSFSISLDLPFAYQEEKEQKEYWDYEVGEIVGYDEAINIQALNGFVEGYQPNQWIVKSKAVNPNAIKKIKMIIPAPQLAAIPPGELVVMVGRNANIVFEDPLDGL